jgi:hypothetical protein
MKAKYPFPVSLSILIMMLCCSHDVNAQTAENSFTISGGEFGKGVSYVFPAGIPEANSLYTGGISQDHKSMTIQAINAIVKSGKQQSVQMQFNMEAAASGTYHFGAPGKRNPPPYASGLIVISSDEINPPHVQAAPAAGTLTITGVGGKGQFITGSFSGSFIQVEEGPVGGSASKIKVVYQISGHFHSYRSPYEGM